MTTPERTAVCIHVSELAMAGVDIKDTWSTVMPDHSMSPCISKGDTICVDSSRKTIKDGKIYAIELDGMFYCKRLLKSEGVIHILSDDEDYPQRELNVIDIMERGFKVMGWVFRWEHVEEHWDSTSTNEVEAEEVVA